MRRRAAVRVWRDVAGTGTAVAAALLLLGASGCPDGGGDGGTSDVAEDSGPDDAVGAEDGAPDAMDSMEETGPGPDAVTDPGMSDSVEDSGPGPDAAADTPGDVPAQDAMGDGAGDAAPGGDDGAADVPAEDVADGPGFQIIWDEIIVPNGCNGGYCHGSAAGGLGMASADDAFANLVGAEATVKVCGVDLRVAAGAPDDSVMYLKVLPLAEAGDVPCGSRMPQGTDGLSSEEAQRVRAWIAGGATR